MTRTANKNLLGIMERTDQRNHNPRLRIKTMSAYQFLFKIYTIFKFSSIQILQTLFSFYFIF